MRPVSFTGRVNLMRVVIANPPWPGEGYGVRSNSRWPHRRPEKILPYPIYLAYAAAVLRRAGFEVFGFDGVKDEESVEDFSSRVASLKPGLVVLETATPSIDSDLECAKAVWEKTGGAHVCLVGAHATYFSEQILSENPFVSSVARGEFDYTVRDLARALRDKTSLAGVEGLSWRNGERTVVNPSRAPIRDLDALPYPARDVFRQEDYRQGWYRKKTYMMLTSRGCPSQCTYCLWPKLMYGHLFRMRSPESVVDEIEFLVKNHGAEELDFDDDTFTMNMDRVAKICDLLVERGLKVQWRCFSKVSTLTEGLVKKMRAAGCYHIAFGIESGSPHILKSICKGISLDQAKKAIAWCREAGIETHATFMFGFPNETRGDIEKTISFATELDSDTAQFSIVTPYPGTEMYEEARNAGLILAKNWSEYDNCHGAIIKTKSLSREDLSRAVSDAYVRYYLRPSKIIKSLLRTRSFGDIVYLVNGARIIISKALFMRR